MASSTLLQDIIKCLLTGILSFSASLLYTNYRLAPEQNVTLVPLSITFAHSDAACTIDKAKLGDALARNSSSKTGSSSLEADSYESYLKILSSYPLVLKEYVQPRFLPNLEKDGILTCNQKVDQGAGMTLEAAALLDRPNQYLMRRSCSMLYKNSELPIHASADVKATDYGVVEPVTLLVRETVNLMFSLDQEQATDIVKNTLLELVGRIGKEDVGLSIKCRVISSGKDGEVEIGGRTYRVRAPHRPT